MARLTKGCARGGTSADPWPPLSVDRRRADHARGLVLRARATGAADRADELAVLDQGNSAARGDDVVEGQEILVIILLNALFEGFGRTAIFDRRARLVLGNGDRAELRPVHPREGDEIGAGI